MRAHGKATSFALKNRVRLAQSTTGGARCWFVFWRSSSRRAWPVAGSAQAQGKAELLWYSQAAFKLTTPGGKVIMIDPWIMGATKIPPELKDLGKIGKVDLVLVTHGHGDHLGDAMEISKTNNVPMWAPAGLNQTLADARPDAGQPRAAHEQGRHDRAVPRRQDHHGPRRAFVGDDPEGSGDRQGHELSPPASRSASSSSSRTASRSSTWATPACSAT